MSARLASPPDRLEAAFAGSNRLGPDAGGPRVLAVARWPVGGIRTHLRYHYDPLAAAGYCFTFVGPDDASLQTLRAGLGCLAGAEFIGVPLRGRSCRFWPVVRRLLCTRRYALVHAHGLTAGVH